MCIHSSEEIALNSKQQGLNLGMALYFGGGDYRKHKGIAYSKNGD
jgi:hypothetical protein